MPVKLNDLHVDMNNYSMQKDNGKNFGLTNSLITTFHTCRMKFWYQICGVRPLARKQTTNFGSGAHELLDKYYSGVKLNTLSIQKYTKQFKHDTDVSMLRRLLGVTQAYLKHYKDTDTKFKVISTENTYIKKFKGVLIKGKIDLHAQHINKSKTNFLMEHKTKSNFNYDYINSFLDYLAIDLQTKLYCWLYPDDINTLVYNMIKNPSRKRQKVKEKHYEFVKRVEDEALEKPEENFHRLEVSYTKQDFIDLERNLTNLLKPIVSACFAGKTKNNPELYCSPWACHLYHSTCPYLSICTTGLINESQFSFGNPSSPELEK